jgi:hypothetical protein
MRPITVTAKVVIEWSVAVDNKRVREPLYEALFLRYGAGAEYLRKFTKTRFWNAFAWFLIVLFTGLWVLFLTWHP